MSKSRLEAFSDGVFAIVITLLVLDIYIPQDQPLTLASLSVVLPHLLAFVLRGAWHRIEHLLHWSDWRRQHQFLAQSFHYRKQNSLLFATQLQL